MIDHDSIRPLKLKLHADAKAIAFDEAYTIASRLHPNLTREQFRVRTEQADVRDPVNRWLFERELFLYSFQFGVGEAQLTDLVTLLAVGQERCTHSGTLIDVGVPTF